MDSLMYPQGMGRLCHNKVGVWKLIAKHLQRHAVPKVYGYES